MEPATIIGLVIGICTFILTVGGSIGGVWLLINRNKWEIGEMKKKIGKMEELVPQKESFYEQKIDNLRKELRDDISDVKKELKTDHNNLSAAHQETDRKVDKALVILAKVEGWIDNEKTQKKK